MFLSESTWRSRGNTEYKAGRMSVLIKTEMPRSKKMAAMSIKNKAVRSKMVFNLLFILA